MTTSPTTIPVVFIGCLECRTPSLLIAVHDTVDGAVAAHPEAQLASAIGDEDWGGDGMTVIFDVEATV